MKECPKEPYSWSVKQGHFLRNKQGKMRSTCGYIISLVLNLHLIHNITANLFQESVSDMKSEESFEFHIVRETPSPSPPPPKAPSIPSVEEEPETEEEEPPEDEDVSFLLPMCGPFCQFYACVGVGDGNANLCSCIFILKAEHRS